MWLKYFKSDEFLNFVRLNPKSTYHFAPSMHIEYWWLEAPINMHYTEETSMKVPLRKHFKRKLEWHQCKYFSVQIFGIFFTQGFFEEKRDMTHTAIKSPKIWIWLKKKTWKITLCCTSISTRSFVRSSIQPRFLFINLILSLEKMFNIQCSYQRVIPSQIAIPFIRT